MAISLMITAVNQLPKTGRVAAHWWWLPLAAALSLLTLYPSEADFHVSQLFYREGEGFTGVDTGYSRLCCTTA